MSRSTYDICLFHTFLLFDIRRRFKTLGECFDKFWSAALSRAIWQVDLVSFSCK